MALGGTATHAPPGTHALAGRAVFPAAPNFDRCTVDDIANWLVASSAPTAIILGEVHDNPIHHKLRAAIIDRVAGSLRDRGALHPAIVFEHIRADQQPALDQNRGGSAAEMLAALNWPQSGWPDQAMFAPLFEAAATWKLPILPGHPPAQIVREVARGGAEALSAEERVRLGLDTPLAPHLHDDLLAELEASHCGLMPKSAFGNMAMAQRYRDAHMARVVAGAARERTTILLAGNGHARKDRGVAAYLPATSSAITVLFIEVEDGKTAAQDYGALHADAVVFTARAARKDPCDEMRAMMQKKK